MRFGKENVPDELDLEFRGPVLRFSRPCNRCRSIQINPDSADVDNDKEKTNGVMATLKNFRCVLCIWEMLK